MNRTLLAGLAGLSLALAGTATAMAAPVTVRVEGATGPLVRAVEVDPSGLGPVTKRGESCDGDTGAGALELATSGDWDASFFDGLGFNVERIKTENRIYSEGSYWGVYVNGAASLGVCSVVPEDGDELLLAPVCAGATSGCNDGTVLEGDAAAVARLGEPLAVTVIQTTNSFDGNGDSSSSRGPSSGASISGGGATGVTGADGIGRVTLAQRGPTELVVTNGQAVRDEVSTCVTDGADGYCGTVGPDGTTLPPEIGGTATGGAGNRGKDTSAPQAAITNIGEGQRFSRKKAPRRLEAKVSDPSGILQVKLSLTRQVGKRCSSFSGKSERFRKTKCGTHPVFAVGDRGDVSYLLPKRLGKGRYVFDVLTTDRAYNRDTLARGRNRVVFTVR